MNPSNIIQWPRDVRVRVESELEPDETVVWAEQPIPGRMAWHMLSVVGMAIPIIAYSLVFLVGAWPSPFRREALTVGSVVVILIALPFFLLGVGMLSGPYWGHKLARRSAYVLTDRRAILIRARWCGEVMVRSIPLRDLSFPKSHKKRDGSGDLSYNQPSRSGRHASSVYSEVDFLAIRDVKAVETMVRALAAKTPGA